MTFRVNRRTRFVRAIVLSPLQTRASVTPTRLPVFPYGRNQFACPVHADLVVKLGTAVINEGVPRELGNHTVD